MDQATAGCQAPLIAFPLETGMVCARPISPSDFDRGKHRRHIREVLGLRRLAGFLDGRAADLEDLADLPGEARLSIDHLMHHGR
jgi:hypothetical protein